MFYSATIQRTIVWEITSQIALLDCSKRQERATISSFCWEKKKKEQNVVKHQKITASHTHKNRHLKFMISMLFYVWEDTSVWAHLNYSFDIHLNCLRLACSFPSSWVPFRVCCQGRLQWLTGWWCAMFLVHIDVVPVLVSPFYEIGGNHFTYWGLLAASSVTYTELATARCYLEDKVGEWSKSTRYLSEYLYYIGTHQPTILPECCHWEGTLLPHFINVIKHCKTHPNKLGCICAHKERYSRSSVGNPIQVGSRNTFILNFVSMNPLHLIHIPHSSSAPGSYSYSQAHNPQTRGKISLPGSDSQKEERFPVVRTMPLDPATF